MKVSLNWIKNFTTITLPKDELIARIGERIGAIEEVIDWGKRYEGVLVAKVISAQQHPDADRLHVVRIDDGGVAKNIERDSDGYVQVVCGAPNVREGLFVAWIGPGVTLPTTANDPKPVVLEARKLRGVLSNGMLASPKELDISEEHTGILEIEGAVKPGMPFVKLFDLDDIIVDIENKMFTHRPDGFGQLGVAREIAGVQDQEFASPAWYKADATIAGENKLNLTVKNEIPDVVPRYSAVALDNITIKPSPAMIQSYLKRVGIRPINNVVDITNYMMVLTGQPLHAFDFDKVAEGENATIVVRYPKPDEELTLLDGKAVKPHAKAILIANQNEAIGLGGAMGGADSEVDQNTKRIILESASFDMYNIRKTCMTHGIFTDAVTRFSKGQSPAQCMAVLAQAVTMLMEDGATVASAVVDNYAKPLQPKTISLDAVFINERLGSDLSVADMAAILSNVEFRVTTTSDTLTVTVPFWRTDIEIPEDIVEEVGRLRGFDAVPVVLPQRDLTPATPDELLAIKSCIRHILARAGANEIQSYTFVHSNLLQKVGQTPEKAYKVRNAISPDLQHYRLSLTPSILEKIHPNIKAGYREFALFELNKVHHKEKPHAIDTHLPAEDSHVGLVVAADKKSLLNNSGAAYYQAKKLLDYLLARLNVTVHYEPLGDHDIDPELAAPFDPKRSAVVISQDEVLGIVGEYKSTVQKAFKLPIFSAGFELATEKLLNNIDRSSSYIVRSQFPGTEQDMTFAIEEEVSFGDVERAIAATLLDRQELQSWVEARDIYQPEGSHKKHVTFRINLQHESKTLTSDDIAAIVHNIESNVGQLTGAVRN